MIASPDITLWRCWLSIQTQKIGGEVGRGRSGVVYFERDERGRDIVEKIFGGDTASKLVLYTFTGAPNPYIWNHDAIACAVARRRILGHLVTVWFGNHLALPRTDGSSWNEKHRAFALHSEFIKGRHAPLRLAPPRPTPAQITADATAIDPLKDLAQNIMKPLQKHLRESGFDGLVWQAGMGNPVAANNFMMIEQDAPTQQAFAHRWVWIDLESGVPALFPANPLALLTFYLPAAIKHRRPMFDDVDIPKLNTYLLTHHDTHAAALNPAAMQEIADAFTSLQKHQAGWKSLSRSDRSIEAACVMGKITNEQVHWFKRHRIIWQAVLMRNGVASAFRHALSAISRSVSNLIQLCRRMLGMSLIQFVTSQRFRTRLSRRIVARRIGVYEKRGQLLRATTKVLRRELRSDESSEYITDFGMHLSFKPLIKTTQWTLVPLLFAYGHITVATGVLMLAFIGPVARTFYTMGRTLQASARRQRLPWVALFIGMIPSAGTLAYPLQLAWAAEHSHRLARFIIDDTFATLGRKLPIWGGPDTFTEHFFNRIPVTIGRWLPGRKP